MTKGRLAAVDISAGVNTLLCTMPSGCNMSVSVYVCNRNTTDVVIRLAHVDGVLTDLADEDWIEYNVTIRSGGVLERTGIKVIGGEQSLVGYSDKGNVTFQVWA